MKIIFRILFILIAFDNVAQLSIHPVIGVSHTASLGIFKSSRIYSGTDVYLGSRLDTKIGSIGIYGTYRFSGSDGSSFGYTMQSHFLGGGLKVQFFNNEKKVRPFIELIALSEYATNYKNSYLTMDGRSPVEGPSTSSYTNPYKEFYYSRFYYSVPFVGSILLGVDIRLVDNLEFNLGFGYGIIGMNTRWAYWKETKEITTEQIEALPIDTDWFNMLDIKLGLTYKFSKKK